MIKYIISMKLSSTHKVQTQIFLVLMFLSFFALSLQSWAGGSGDEDTDQETDISRQRKKLRSLRPGGGGGGGASGLASPDPSKTAFIFTPNRTTVSQALDMSPASQDLRFVIYLIHDHPLLSFNKVDLESRVIGAEEFELKMGDFKHLTRSLRQSGTLHGFHRYIGYVSQRKRTDRSASKRFSEHVRDCNSVKRSSEKRLYLGLRNNSGLGVRTRMTVLAYNIHPTQIAAVEAYLIRLFGGLEDLGWNSSSGSLLALANLLTPSTSAVVGSPSLAATASASSYEIGPAGGLGAVEFEDSGDDSDLMGQVEQMEDESALWELFGASSQEIESTATDSFSECEPEVDSSASGAAGGAMRDAASLERGARMSMSSDLNSSSQLVFNQSAPNSSGDAVAGLGVDLSAHAEEACAANSQDHLAHSSDTSQESFSSFAKRTLRYSED